MARLQAVRSLLKLSSSDARKEHLERAINGPLFGRWTREIIVLRHYLRMEETKRLMLSEQANESYMLFANLLVRLCNVRRVSISTDWYEWPLRHVQKGLHGSLELRELRLVQIGEIPQLFGLACEAVKDYPTLEHLYLQYSGSSTAYTVAPPLPPLETLPQPAFKKLSLKIGGTSDLSLHYIRWLTCPRSNGEQSFRLQSLSLDLTTCYRNDRKCLEALEPCLHALDELIINVNGLSDVLASSIFMSCAGLKRLTLIARHTFERAMLDQIPQTLEDIAVDFSFEAPDWEEWDQRTMWFIRTRLNPLRRLRVRMLYAGKVMDTANTYRRSKALCAELGIVGEFICEPVGSRYNL